MLLIVEAGKGVDNFREIDLSASDLRICFGQGRGLGMGIFGLGQYLLAHGTVVKQSALIKRAKKGQRRIMVYKS